MALTFNNKDMGSWLAIIAAILKSGFTFKEMFFQDGVKNYKQTAHTKYEGSPYGDFIYLFTKNTNEKTRSIPTGNNGESTMIEEINKIFKEHNQIINEKSNIQIIDMFKNYPLSRKFYFK